MSGPQGRSGQVRKNLAPTGIRSPDRPARKSVATPTELPGPHVNVYITQFMVINASLVTEIIIKKVTVHHMTCHEGKEGGIQVQLYSFFMFGARRGKW